MLSPSSFSKKKPTPHVVWALRENKENPGLHHRKHRFQYKEFAGVKGCNYQIEQLNRCSNMTNINYFI